MRAGILLVVGLGLAACGGGGDDVRSVASDWLRAVYASDGDRACELLAPHVVAKLPDCATTYSMLGEALGETLGGDPALRPDALVRVDGEWRVVRGFRSS